MFAVRDDLGSKAEVEGELEPGETKCPLFTYSW